MKTVILIPCYNESKTIAKVVGDFKRTMPHADIYVYDNNSTDGTDKIARDAGAIVRYEYRQGKGNVVRSMFREITADCYTTHNYDRLLRNPRFNEVIRKTGMEFIECRGGYVTDFTFATDNFEMKDDLDLSVVFKAGSKKRVYDLDLKKMELSERYFEY